MNFAAWPLAVDKMLVGRAAFVFPLPFLLCLFSVFEYRGFVKFPAMFGRKVFDFHALILKLLESMEVYYAGLWLTALPRGASLRGKEMAPVWAFPIVPNQPVLSYLS